MKHLLVNSSLMVLLSAVSCQQITVVIDNIPENTPAGSEIHVTGNFNYWDPSDPNFILEKHPEGYYYLTLPPGIGDIDFLFTRGDWTTVEADVCGNKIQYHSSDLGTNDTIRFDIQSWMDLGPTHCPKVTFMVESIPENTPGADHIYVTGNFNSWNPGNEEFSMENKEGKYYYTIDLDSTLERIEYKFTRGDWDRVEVDVNGREFPYRQFEYGTADTIRVKIPNWSDMVVEEVAYVTFLIEDIPGNTPIGDHIYMAGSFNNWYPRDKNYELTGLPNGNYFISLPQKTGSMEYKFTRGSWETVEEPSAGTSTDNRVFEYGTADTVRLTIQSWVDVVDR